LPAAGGNTEQEQYHFSAFAQHRHAHHRGQRRKRTVAEFYILPDRAHLRRQLTRMGGHPGHVPAQHEHRQAEHGRGENFLPGAIERIRERAGEYRQQRGARHAGRHATANPTQPARHALGGSQHDAHDEPGFQRLTEHYNQACQHARLLDGSRNACPPRLLRRILN
jgi:hypothetical protein